jgi:septal ring factor EnvC (AmiA/AmiB activator)
VLWGQHTDHLTGILAKTSGELTKTKSWLLDEIQSSDERHKRVSATLTKALADLAEARAELARIHAALKQNVGNNGNRRPLNANDLREATRHTSDAR